ncbi:nuclear transport factor 2 family protein [Azohydromonas aeria]|uniref:nuclear transport factor 2 family protein n=1 Tax=Azohydromonas aeria TaxID=2590212 RepID=UPI0012F9346D|nr:nuclear transport factor 2 family protein [Azohydromonas aeria]
MRREQFDDYVRRFNARDTSAFDDYLAHDVRVQNGGLHYEGVQAMKDHYGRIWSSMKETLTVKRFVADEETAAVELHTHFEVERDDPASVFGPVLAGETFDYTGIVMYRIRDLRFADIRVSYLGFERTLDGVRRSMGIPH